MGVGSCEPRPSPEPSKTPSHVPSTLPLPAPTASPSLQPSPAPTLLPSLATARRLEVSFAVAAAAPPTLAQEASLQAAVEASTGGRPVSNFRVASSLVAARRRLAALALGKAGAGAVGGGSGEASTGDAARPRSLASYLWLVTLDVLEAEATAADGLKDVTTALRAQTFASQVCRTRASHMHVTVHYGPSLILVDLSRPPLWTSRSLSVSAKCPPFMFAPKHTS